MRYVLDVLVYMCLGPSRGSALPWNLRLKIALDTARYVSRSMSSSSSSSSTGDNMVVVIDSFILI